MSLLDVFRIAGSGLTAQRLRLDVTANNIANAETTRTPQGGPYIPEHVVFQPLVTNGQLRYATAGHNLATSGVQVTAIVPDPTPPRRVHDPSHPDADAEGFVAMPNIDLVTEMTDLLSASRAYEANLAVLNVAKNMAQRALDIGRG